MDLTLPSEGEVHHLPLPPLAAGWTNEDFFRLLKMYTDHCSLTTMAVHFQKTRGQISGTLHRARAKGLIQRIRPQGPGYGICPPKPVQGPPKPPTDPGGFAAVALAKRIRAAQAAPKPKAPRVRLRLVEDPKMVTFEQLEWHMCKWPIGDPRQSDFRFCGCDRVLKKPYCEVHVTKAGRLYDLQQHP